MQVVVDANVVFSSLLSKGRTFSVFALNRILGEFEFVSPEFLLVEIANNFGELSRRSGLSLEQIGAVYRLVRSQVDFIPFSEFKDQESAAERLLPPGHAKDVPYFALALKLGCPIWSYEKRFAYQKEVKLLATNELIGLLMSRI